MNRPFGEAAVLVDTDDARGARALAEAIRRAPPEGVTGSVAGRASVVVEWDPLRTALPDVSAAIHAVSVEPLEAGAPRRRVIPVVYGGASGPDLDDVAASLGASPDDVVARHTEVELEVLFSGFAPGFAYLGDLPDDLAVRRLATPRTRTPRGSVALADGMSGIYPDDLPGGWRIIGWTPITLFDPARVPPAYLLPGDRVRFVAVDRREAEDRAGTPDDW